MYTQDNVVTGPQQKSMKVWHVKEVDCNKDFCSAASCKVMRTLGIAAVRAFACLPQYCTKFVSLLLQ